MVGVSGRSKGCPECRKRKIKCSLERPACGQCQRTKRECSGYAKSTIFLNTSSKTHALQSREVLNITNVPDDTFGNLDHPDLSSQSEDRTQRKEGPVILLRSLDTEVLQQNKVLADFVNSTLPKDATRQPPLIWITSILDSVDCSESLILAGSAIGHGWQGHVDFQYDRVNHSRQLYSGSLSLLRQDLARGQARHTERALATSCALVLYEVPVFLPCAVIC